MFAKVVRWLTRIFSLLIIVAFIAASSKIWLPTDPWFHDDLASPADWNYIFFAALVQIIEMVVYYTLLTILWMRATNILNSQPDNGFSAVPIFTELIKTLGEAFAVIIVEIHVVFAMVKLFAVTINTDLAYAKFVPTFIYDFYNSLETYLFTDFCFFGETVFVPIAIIILGTFLALSQLFISYKCSDLFSGIESASRR